jgi:hypothetical protein
MVFPDPTKNYGPRSTVLDVYYDEVWLPGVRGPTLPTMTHDTQDVEQGKKLTLR